MLTGQNGILQRATDANEETNKSQLEEQIKLAISEALIEGYGSLTNSNLQKAIKSEVKSAVITGSGPWDIYSQNNMYTISENGEVALITSNIKAGMYKNNNIIKTWEELIEDGTIIVENGVLSTPADNESGVISSNGYQISASREILEGTIIVDSNVTAIDNAAFEHCVNITNIVLPNNVSSIGIDAFRSCQSIVSINIPSSVKNIGKNAFSNTLVNTVEIPDGCILDEQAFAFCNDLSDVIVGKDVELGTNSFTSSKLINLHIGDNSIIGRRAFLNCSSLINVNINSGVNIGIESFAGCSSLKNITINTGVTSIGERAFLGCSAINSLDIPSTVITIGENAFVGINHINYSGIATGEPWGANYIN